MKRWPVVISFVLFIALCATLAYWAMQFFKPPVRQVAAPPPSTQAPVNVDAAASLFGGKGSAAVASNFQLKGVIMAGDPKDSVVILAADGKPAQAIRAGAEIAPGVKVKEVNRRYIVLLDNGVEKRVDLPEENQLAMGAEGASAAPVAASPMPARPAPAMPATMVNNPKLDSSSGGRESSTPASADASPAANTSSAPATPGPGSTGTSTAAPQTAVPEAAPPSGLSQAMPAPGTGMGSPPVTNQGSLAGTAQNPSTPVAPVRPGMPVPAAPPRP